MKINAILRIIIWSLVILVLVSLMGAVLSGSFLFHRNQAAAIEAPAEEAPAVLVETEYLDIEATVTADAVNVRTAPSSSSSTVGYVEKDDTILIGRAEEVDGEKWLWISSPTTGWMKAEYVRAGEPIPFDPGTSTESALSESSNSTGLTATVADTLNIRSAPNGESSVVGLLQAGDAVTITRQESISGKKWAYITSPEAGWVQMEYLNTGTPVSAAPASDISLDARQIREIKIEWAAGNITIEPADVDTIQVSEAAHADNQYAMVWKQNNDKLTIRFSENVSLDFNFGIDLIDVISKDLTILVPMGWECDSLEVDAASATLDVKNLVIGEMDFDGASGTCNFVNCVIEELDLDTASGDIHFTGSLDTLDCDAASASVFAVFDNVPSRISMDSMSGDLDITLPSNAGFNVTMDGLSTDFVSDFGYAQNRDGSYSRGNGQCKINMDAMSGDLYIREYKEADAVPEASTTP